MRNIKVIDELNPEDSAMLQALYSRSANSVDEHMKKVASTGSGKFMESYYVGYSHKSIGDCGSTTIFIEGVSMLAAKAIQDWPLYSGQETSTRYIDMGKQGIYDPVESEASVEILHKWMEFYIDKQSTVSDTIRIKYPRQDDEDEKVYERAVKARTFDIMRGFLPAGIKTQLSWHTNLRQAADHLTWMASHPLFEVQAIALDIAVQLHEKYPSSGFNRLFDDTTVDDPRDEWYTRVMDQYAYESVVLNDDMGVEDIHLRADGYDISKDEEVLLRDRPRGCLLPHRFTDLGTYHYEFTLDFGSFRDLQRHRNGVIRMPLLTTGFGFEPWYLEQLGDLREQAETLLREQAERIAQLDCSDELRQYYLPMGYRVSCQVTMGLPALVYFLELRSSKMVHPTLRRKVHGMSSEFRSVVGDKIALYVNMDPDDWDVRRGTQTITERTGRKERTEQT